MNSKVLFVVQFFGTWIISNWLLELFIQLLKMFDWSVFISIMHNHMSLSRSHLFY